MPTRSLPVSLLLIAGACAPQDDLALGIAVWPFILGTDTGQPSPDARGTEVIVCVAEVSDDYFFDQIPVSGANVSIRHAGDDPYPLFAATSGVYGTAGVALSGLPYIPGDLYEVTVVYRGETYTVEGPAAQPLPASVGDEQHPAGEDLTLALPNGYEDDYDQVMVSVYDDRGVEVFSDRPKTMSGWLQFAASSDTPDDIEIEGDVLSSPDTAYAVTVLGVVRARRRCARTT